MTVKTIILIYMLKTPQLSSKSVEVKGMTELTKDISALESP